MSIIEEVAPVINAVETGPRNGVKAPPIAPPKPAPTYVCHKENSHSETLKPFCIILAPTSATSYPPSPITSPILAPISIATITKCPLGSTYMIGLFKQ